MLDKNGVEIKVGDKFLGVKFSDHHPVGYADEMDKLVGKELTVLNLDENFYNSVTVDSNGATCAEIWWYPSELIEIIPAKVDKSKKSDTIKTSKQQAPKRTIWVVFGPGGIIYDACYTRREAREANRSLGGGLQIHKMETVAKYKAKSN